MKKIEISRLTRRAGRTGLMLLAACPLAALSQPASLADCAGIAEDGKRLACFDELAAASQAGKGNIGGNVGGSGRDSKRSAGERENNVSRPALTTSLVPAASKTADLAETADPTDTAEPSSPAPSPAVSASSEPAEPRAEPRDRSLLARHWELGRENKHGTFDFRPHLPTYILATYSDSPNSEPYRPYKRFLSDSAELSHAELAFQLSFKTKLLETPLRKPVDLWFGYTQQSFWQAGNREASSPFRETNYQPELMAVMPLNFQFLGMRARFLNLALVHQSNGQGATLSRSWDRVYAQLGMERDDLTMAVRIWQRRSEAADDDDNPDIVDYMGRGDVTATYRWRGHEFSTLARYNFDTHKGAAQLGWAFPIAHRLKGYMQFFSGYGQSLIDYNHSQKTLGLGIQLSY